MINDFFKELSDYVKARLDWVCIAGKNVSYIKTDNGDIPIQCFDGDCKEPETYLVPSANKESILYFDLKGVEDTTKNDPCLQVLKLKFDAFFWYNCNKIKVVVDGQEKNCCEKLDFIYQELVKVIKEYDNTLVHKSTQFTVTKSHIKRGLLTHPYYNFNLSFEVMVKVNLCNESTGSEPTITITKEVC